MSDKEAIKKLLYLLKKYEKTIIIIVLCLFLSTGLYLCIPILSKNIMDQGFLGNNKKLLILLVLFSFVIYFFINVLDIVKEKKRNNIAAKMEYSLWEQSFNHLLKLKVEYYDKKNYAEILNDISVDIANITSIANEGVLFIVTQVFSILGGIAGLLIIDYRLTLLVLVFVPVKYLVMKYFAKLRKKYMDSFIKMSQDYAGWFGDAIGGIREIKLFNISSYKQKEFALKQKAIIDKNMEMNMLGEWNIVTDHFLLHILQTIIYIIGANMVFDLDLSVGSIFAFITYSAYVTGPISAILNIGYILTGVIPSTKRFYEFMSVPEEVQNDCTHGAVFGDIELKNVTFSYVKDHFIFDHLNLIIPKGQNIAIFGGNGSGKSTIINILTRLYDIDSGAVLLAGKNMQEISVNDYRNMYAVVSQQVYLFNDTIRNNICMYQKMDDIELHKILKDVELDEFIKEVSLDYVVGHNGLMLSGGQKQKIALARALAHDKPVVIFDEATSNVDIHSTIQIDKLLDTRLKEKTVIIVTHKVDILKDVDYIVFLDNGNVITGNYRKLYDQNMNFKELTEMVWAKDIVG